MSTPPRFRAVALVYAVSTLAAVLLAACGGGEAQAPADGQSQANRVTQTSATLPIRLRIDGTHVLSPDGTPLRLRGVNVNGVSDEDVRVITDQFHMNMIRLQIVFAPENRADTESGFSDAYLAQVDQWVAAARARKLWMVLEMRANDPVANSPDLYDTSKTGPCDKPTRCANFGYYLKAWKAIAERYKGSDYIAGYGLLAEPSAERTGLPHPDLALLNFQKTLMDAITNVDERTPFFVGTNFNYDTMEFVNDAYFDKLADKYRGRLVYEVNFLTPKEWIQHGTWTVECKTSTNDCPNPTYPFADPADGYDSLLDGDPAEGMERNYNLQRVKDGNYQKTLSKGLIAWYLQWPLEFRQRHQVPLYVDQFGASTEALGQLAYEEDLIDFFEAHDLHWTRWSYNAAGPDSAARTLLPPNYAAIRFYTELGKRWKQ